MEEVLHLIRNSEKETEQFSAVLDHPQFRANPFATIQVLTPIPLSRVSRASRVSRVSLYLSILILRCVKGD